MAQSTNTKRYQIGKGLLEFNQFDTNGNLTSWRSLGSAPEVSLATESETLEHTDPTSGLNEIDLEVITKITTTLSFSLEELGSSNMAMAFLGSGTAVTDAATTNQSQSITVEALDRTYDIDGRSVGITVLPYGDSGANVLFVVGEVVTGTTSTASGTIVEVDGDATSGNLLLVSVAGGPFTAGEDLTGDGTGVAEASATEVFSTTRLAATDGGTALVEGDDYVLESASGKIYFPLTSSLSAGDTVALVYETLEASYEVIQAYSKTELTGQIRFTSANPVGAQQQYTFWKTSLKPTGDIALIGEEWSNIGFEAKVLSDTVNHPEGKIEIIVVEQ